MMVNFRRISMMLVIFLMVACGNNTESTQEADYEKTKKMIVDILQTEDGKKALNEVLNDDAMKHHLVIDSDTVRNALREQLVSEKGSEIWANYFSDPMFVESFAKSFEKEHIDLIQRALNDPAFQKQFIEIIQDPELIDHFLSMMKSTNFRTHLETLIEQTLDTPAFQGKILKMIQQTEKSGEGKGESKEQSSDADEKESNSKEEQNEGED